MSGRISQSVSESQVSAWTQTSSQDLLMQFFFSAHGRCRLNEASDCSPGADVKPTTRRRAAVTPSRCVLCVCVCAAVQESRPHSGPEDFVR